MSTQIITKRIAVIGIAGLFIYVITGPTSHALAAAPPLPAPPQNVTVINGTANPVPVVQQGPVTINSPGQPVNLNLDTIGHLYYRVPSNKRLHITFVNIAAYNDQAENCLDRAVVTVELTSPQGIWRFATTPIKNLESWNLGGSITDILLDSDELLTLFFEASSCGLNTYCTAQITATLLDATGPPILNLQGSQTH